VRDQCQAAGVPFFFKQWGGFRPVGCADMDSPDWDAQAVMTADVDATVRVWPDGCVDGGNEYLKEHGAWFMEPAGKKASGRLLDGRTWDELPEMLRGG
jgi:protein gp37